MFSGSIAFIGKIAFSFLLKLFISHVIKGCTPTTLYSASAELYFQTKITFMYTVHDHKKLEKYKYTMMISQLLASQGFMKSFNYKAVSQNCIQLGKIRLMHYTAVWRFISFYLINDRRSAQLV